MTFDCTTMTRFAPSPRPMIPPGPLADEFPEMANTRSESGAAGGTSTSGTVPSFARSTPLDTPKAANDPDPLSDESHAIGDGPLVEVPRHVMPPENAPSPSNAVPRFFTCAPSRILKMREDASPAGDATRPNRMSIVPTSYSTPAPGTPSTR